jgi:hypothetical protein
MKPPFSDALYPDFRKVRNYTSIGGQEVPSLLPLNAGVKR